MLQMLNKETRDTHTAAKHLADLIHARLTCEVVFTTTVDMVPC